MFPNQQAQRLREAVIQEGKSRILFQTGGFDASESSYFSSVERIHNVIFLSTPYINQYGNQEETNEVVIDICLINFASNITKVSTELINQNGSIQEVVSMSSPSFSIAGVLIGQNIAPSADDPVSGLPLEDMKNLLSVHQNKVVVDVASDYLSELGIDKLFIDSINFPQESDKYNVQSFTMQCTAVNPSLSIL